MIDAAPRDEAGTARVRKPGIIPALDGFRAIAVTLVMLSHVGLNRLLPGQFGVTLFFFLSGYLIATLLRRDIEQGGAIDFGGFYLRRAVRILPPMYVTICFVALLSLAGLIHPLNYGGLIWDFLFLSNYHFTSGIPIGLWSLAVEEHFYVIFPLLLAAMTRRFSFAQCAVICLALCLLVLLIRFQEVSRLADFSQVNFWTHTRFDSILYGAILALWNNPVADRRNRLPGPMLSYLVAGLLLLITFVLRDEAFRQTLRYSLQGLALLILFNAAIRDDRFARPVLDNPVTRFLALHSYTLYLVHGTFLLACEPLVAFFGRIATFSLAIVLSVLFAILMHRLIEHPLGRWRRRVERARREHRSAEAANAL